MLKRTTSIGLGLAIILATSCFLFASQSAAAQWPQWGGPDRNFSVPNAGLAKKWLPDGPPRLWHRKLGDGFASIVVDEDRLFTMYRKDKEHECTIALDAKTGETLWEHPHATELPKEVSEWGFGPNSTPLIVGDRLFSIGAYGMMHCFDKKTGKVLWKKPLSELKSGWVMGFGYASSPIAYKKTVIAAGVCPEGQDAPVKLDLPPSSEPIKNTLVALDQSDGHVVWTALDHGIDFSSPIIAELDGRPILIFVYQQGIAALNPDTGKVLWDQPFQTPYENIPTPVWLDGGKLLYSRPYGGFLLQLKWEGPDKISSRILWRGSQLRQHLGNSVRLGDNVLTTHGAETTVLTLVDPNTGKQLWAKRGYNNCTLVNAEGTVILLNEDGQLTLARPTPDGLHARSRCQIAEKHALTVPTLAGTRLYVRDRKNIMAFDLSKAANKQPPKEKGTTDKT